MEILFAIGILCFMIYIVYSSFEKKALGGCGCGNCSELKRKLK